MYWFIDSFFLLLFLFLYGKRMNLKTSRKIVFTMENRLWVVWKIDSDSFNIYGYLSIVFVQLFYVLKEYIYRYLMYYQHPTVCG